MRRANVRGLDFQVVHVKVEPFLEGHEGRSNVQVTPLDIGKQAAAGGRGRASREDDFAAQLLGDYGGTG